MTDETPAEHSAEQQREPNLQVRRANLDDLPKLIALWKQDGLPWEELETRFKEFQIIEDAKGNFLAALGFLIARQEGRLHSECFAHPDQADELRARLWERIQIQAKNHGLTRIWTDSQAPFWHSHGLQLADENALKNLPESFAGTSHPWSFIQLRDDKAAEISIDKEFMLFKEAEKEQTEKIFRQARVLKVVAAIMAILLLILVVVWAIYFLKFQAQTGQSTRIPARPSLPPPILVNNLGDFNLVRLFPARYALEVQQPNSKIWMSCHQVWSPFPPPSRIS